ncbi:Phloem protein 2-like [Macleaya cordata]|uniref:Phloem protein 2-like n=1 Tax=Macleaya cordata TaxID=56857 RepID=A0A200QN23_MACCD|nr:Phloem protein 2-like [Macleaya cordata]
MMMRNNMISSPEPAVVEDGNNPSSPHWNGCSGSSNDTIFKEHPQNSGILHLSPRALSIIWGNDKRFWQWISLDEEEKSVFGIGAELLQVNWIEVTGKLEYSKYNKLHPKMTYEIYYVVKFKVDAFGWHSIPIKFLVKQQIQNEEEKLIVETSEILEPYRKSIDVWHCIYGGHFTVPDDSKGFVEFGMFEVDSDWWKGSMVLQGIKFQPKKKDPNTVLIN